MRIYLTKRQITFAKKRLAFEEKGKIANFCHRRYKVCRTTIYRHLNSDPQKYLTTPKTSKMKELEDVDKLYPTAYMVIHELKEKEGKNSKEIAEELGADLKVVNLLFI